MRPRLYTGEGPRSGARCTIVDLLGRSRRVRFDDGAEMVVLRDYLRAAPLHADVEIAAMPRGARRYRLYRQAGRCATCGQPSGRHARCFPCRRRFAVEQAARDARKRAARSEQPAQEATT